MRKQWFQKKIEYLQSLRVGKDLLKGTEKVPKLKKSDKLDYNKTKKKFSSSKGTIEGPTA